MHLFLVVVRDYVCDGRDTAVRIDGRTERGRACRKEIRLSIFLSRTLIRRKATRWIVADLIRIKGKTSNEESSECMTSRNQPGRAEAGERLPAGPFARLAEPLQFYSI